MPGGIDHSAYRRRVFHYHAMTNAAQSKTTHRSNDVLQMAGSALHLRQFDLTAHVLAPIICSSVLPRLAAISSGARMLDRASMVARTTLIGLREPWLLASTLRTP